MVPDLLEPTPEILELTDQKFNSLMELQKFLMTQQKIEG